MLKKFMLVFALVAFGCGEEKAADPSEDGEKPGKGAKDAATNDARGSSTSEDDEDGGTPNGETSKGDAGNTPGKPAPIDDAGSVAVKLPDGGSVIVTPGKDAGVPLEFTGSCCEAHDTPGCDDALLMACACEMNQACCTDAWSAGCVFLVTQKYCQPKVRDCVCNPEPQWNKSECCTTEWNESCDIVGRNKCGQKRDCS
jgi:hypothetical protein